jgi:hypothetical protein
MTSFERESVEFLPVTITVNEQPVTTGVQFAIVPVGARPTTYAPPTTLEGKIGVMIQDLEPGWYRIWAQVTDTPEAPVIQCGDIAIT